MLCEVKFGLPAGARELAGRALHFALHLTDTSRPRDTPQCQWSDLGEESKQGEDRDATSHQRTRQATGFLRTKEVDPSYVGQH